MNKGKQKTSLNSRLAENDHEAFKDIYTLNHNRLLRYGLIIYKNQEVVSDVIQDLFVWIWQKRHELDRINNLEVYLFKSLKRNLLSYLSKQKVLLRDGYHSSGHDPNIEERIIEEEIAGYNQKWLMQQLDNLPSKQKEVIYLRYYEGLTYDEIAEILSKSNQVVRNYASRALSQMRRSVMTKPESD